MECKFVQCLSKLYSFLSKSINAFLFTTVYQHRSMSTGTRVSARVTVLAQHLTVNNLVRPLPSQQRVIAEAAAHTKTRETATGMGEYSDLS